MHRRFAILLAMAVVLAAASASPAAAQVRIGVVLSITGASSSQGGPQRNSIALLPKEVGGQSVEYIVLDDGTDSARAVAATRKLIDEDKVDAVIGSTITPSSLAMIAVAAERKVPMISLATSSRVIMPMDEQRRWVFKTSQNDSLMSDAIAKHMHKSGVRSVGFIGFSDSLGDGWLAEVTRALGAWQVALVATERFGRTDTDVSGQVQKVMAAKPDAVLIAGSGTPPVLPQKALRERGYAGRYYQTHGVANMDFVRAGGRDVEGTILPVGPVLVASQLPESHPAKALAEDYVSKYEAIYGAGSASTLGAYMFDAAIMLQSAIPAALLTAKPGTPAFRLALRDALETAYGLVLTNGVSEMTADDHNGFDTRAHVMVTIVDGKWKLLPRNQQ